MSSVTERHNAPGTFTVDLRDDAPADVTRQLHLTARHVTSKGYGLIVVTPQRVEPADFPNPAVPSTTAHPLLSAARYAGVLLDSDSRRTRLAGAGLLYLLGRDADTGHIHSDFADKAATETASTLVTNLIGGGSSMANVLGAGTIGLNPSPLRVGTIYAGGGTLTIGDQLKTTRRWLADVSAGAGRRSYRVRPTGHLDWGTRTQLWSIFPRAMVGRLPAADDPKWMTVRTLAEWDESIADFADQAIADPAGVGTAQTSSAPSPAFVSPLRMDTLLLRTIIEPEAGESGAAYLARTDEALATGLNISTISSTELTGVIVPKAGDPTPLEPGEPIYLYDPAAGLIDTSNAETYGGDLIRPLARYLAAITWPIVQGMGVYLLWVDRSFGNVQRILELTEYVEFNTNAEARLEVGAPAPTL